MTWTHLWALEEDDGGKEVDYDVWFTFYKGFISRGNKRVDKSN